METAASLRSQQENLPHAKPDPHRIVHVGLAVGNLLDLHRTDPLRRSHRLRPPGQDNATHEPHKITDGSSPDEGRTLIEHGLATTGSAGSFDHLIGTGEEQGRNGESEGLGCPKVDNKLKDGRLLDR